MPVRIVDQPFDPFDAIRECERDLGARLRGIGALATFIGRMRDVNEGVGVERMTLEHYPGMTERHLERLAEQARARWSLDEVLIVHRVGTVTPTEALVLVATWSCHRAHAFESCRHVMEDLKSSAPFWKREETTSGARWVAGNTPGSTAEF